MRKMDLWWSLPSMPGACLWLLELLSVELLKQNQGIVEKNSGFVTGYWNLVPGKQQGKPEFPFQMQHVNTWLGSLPSRASAIQVQ